MPIDEALLGENVGIDESLLGPAEEEELPPLPGFETPEFERRMLQADLGAARAELLPRILPPAAELAEQTMAGVSAPFTTVRNVFRSLYGAPPVAPGTPIIPFLEEGVSPEQIQTISGAVERALTGRETVLPPGITEPVAGAATGAARFGAALTTPEMLPFAAAGGVAAPIRGAAGTIFGTQMVGQLPEAAAEAGRVSVEGTPFERGLAYTEAGLTGALPLTIATSPFLTRYQMPEFLRERGRLSPIEFPEGVTLPAAPTPPTRPTPRPSRPTVPTTPAQRRETVLDEIRRNQATTIRQIQNLFPESKLTRERARELRDRAFPGEALARTEAEKARAIERLRQDQAEFERTGEGTAEGQAIKNKYEGRLPSQVTPDEAVKLAQQRAATGAVTTPAAVAKITLTPESVSMAPLDAFAQALKESGKQASQVGHELAVDLTPEKTAFLNEMVPIAEAEVAKLGSEFEAAISGDPQFAQSATKAAFVGHQNAIQRVNVMREAIRMREALDRVAKGEDVALVEREGGWGEGDVRRLLPKAPAPAAEAAAPSTIEQRVIAGKSLAEWEAVRDAADLPKGIPRAELAKFLAVKNTPKTILGALANKKRTREIHAPGKAEVPAAPVQLEPAPTVPAVAEPAGKGAPKEHWTFIQLDEAATAKIQAEVSDLRARTGQRAAKDVKQDLIERVEAAIKAAPEEVDVNAKTVTLDIPGDGTFTVFNTKKNLRQFLNERVKKLATTAEAPQPTAYRKVRPPKLPAAKTGDQRILSPLTEFVSTDPSRFVLQSAWSDGTRIVASDGRILLAAKGKFGGTKENPRKVDPATGKDAETAEGEKPPEWDQIIPTQNEIQPKGELDIESLYVAARQARPMFEGSAETSFVNLYVAKDGTVGLTATIPGIGDLRLGTIEGEPLGQFDVDYLMRVAHAAGELGSRKVRIGISTAQRSQNALILQGDDWIMIQMGFREPPPAEPTVPTGPISVGPGAMSPAQAAERTAKAQQGQRPPGNNPPVAIPPDQTPTPNIIGSELPFDVVNPVNSPQFTFYFGRLGPTAKAAWEKLALGDFEMREGIGRDVAQYIDSTLAGLPRGMRKQGGKTFFEALDGKTMEQIEAEWSGRPEGERVIEAARGVKQRLEEIRVTLRDTKRESYNAYLMSLDKATLEELFRRNVSDAVDISGYRKQELAQGLTLSEFPDDWGVADGSYMPHVFYGNWRVSAQMPGADSGQFMFRARTPQEAKARIYKMVRDNPDLADATWNVEVGTVVPADMVRLGDRNFWRLVGEMKDAAGISTSETKQAMQGIIGRRAAKQKWWGNLQQRYGFENYEKNYRAVMTSYLTGFHRWRVLNQLNRDVQPMIEQVRREGRRNAAQELDELLSFMWGKPAKSTELVDSVIRATPVLRDWIRPMALDRWSRNIRRVVSFLTLRNLRYATVNRLQPLQGLYPLLGEKTLVQAKRLQHSAEGRRILDESGVRFDPGQYGEHRFIVPSKVREIVERWSGERSNQELAFLAMYLHGRQSGLPHEAAIPYAKLRGQLLTQFTPISADIPPIMRGPFTGLLFQFKRFPIKQLELMYQLGRTGHLSGIARWLLVMAAFGGASYYLRQFMVPGDKRKRIKNAADQAVGESNADAVLYGLPGLAGIDISTSLVLGDEPFGQTLYEKAGRAVLGPAVSMAIEAKRAAATERREPLTPQQEAENVLRRFPTLRPLAELSAMARGDLDLRSPDGEVRYKRKLQEALVGLGGFRSTAESNTRIALDAAFTLERERNDLKNAYFVATQGGGGDAEIVAIQNFNQRWPEFGINADELIQYLRRRQAGLTKTDAERVVGRRFRSLLPPEQRE